MTVLKFIGDVLVRDVALVDGGAAAGSAVCSARGGTAVAAVVAVAALVVAVLAVGASAALAPPPIWHAASDTRTTSISPRRAKARNPQ
jgi:hypothetical protein